MPTTLQIKMRWLLVLLAFAGVAPLAPCAAAQPWVVIDDEGGRLELAAPARRIVSLAPGATEMLFAAGAGKYIIATVEYADEPTAASRIPRVGDAQAFDIERILSLQPDVVVVWSSGNSPASIAKLAALRLPLYRHRVDTLTGLAASVRRLGAVANTPRDAESSATDIEQRLARLRARAKAAVPPRVLLQVWNTPLYTVGARQPMSEALELCGTRNLFADLDDPGPAVTVESVIARNPEIIVAAGEEVQAQRWLDAWRKFGTLDAVRRGNLIAFADPAFTRTGPAAIGATERLCALLDQAH